MRLRDGLRIANHFVVILKELRPAHEVGAVHFLASGADVLCGHFKRHSHNGAVITLGRGRNACGWLAGGQADRSRELTHLAKLASGEAALAVVGRNLHLGDVDRLIENGRAVPEKADIALCSVLLNGGAVVGRTLGAGLKVGSGDGDALKVETGLVGLLECGIEVHELGFRVEVGSDEPAGNLPKEMTLTLVGFDGVQLGNVVIEHVSNLLRY